MNKYLLSVLSSLIVGIFIGSIFPIFFEKEIIEKHPLKINDSLVIKENIVHRDKECPDQSLLTTKTEVVTKNIEPSYKKAQYSYNEYLKQKDYKSQKSYVFNAINDHNYDLIKSAYLNQDYEPIYYFINNPTISKDTKINFVKNIIADQSYSTSSIGVEFLIEQSDSIQDKISILENYLEKETKGNQNPYLSLAELFSGEDALTRNNVLEIIIESTSFHSSINNEPNYQKVRSEVIQQIKQNLNISPK